ncbi:methyltransferase family protein [Pelagibacterium limicola]|uniref:methyltransferase family protein n=1 Tax=Pelagibacterium limicola TaxID=2791022 RepID=UPI0018AF9D16|nr:isoprenylcysteine carboxylmethyltransferase family protein [Pelagibacterium limicola]
MTEIQNDNPGLPHIPPTYPVAFLLLAIFLEFLVPIRFLAAPAVLAIQTLAGVLLVLAGLTLDIWAFRLFKAAGTNPEPFKPTTAIVVDGPYRMTRNPMYVGFLLLFTGIGLVFALEWTLILVPLLWLTLDRVVVRREEAYLTAKFGAAYTDFLARTRRWI